LSPQDRGDASCLGFAALDLIGLDWAAAFMGKLTKKLGRLPPVQRALAALAAGLMSAVKITTRWRAINADIAAPAWAGDKPVIVAFWHNRLAMMPACWRRRLDAGATIGRVDFTCGGFGQPPHRFKNLG
jgi:hypothetical protein